MSVHSQRNQLGAQMKQLLGQWSETKIHWRDNKSAEFEKRYLAELVDNVNAAMVVLEKLDETLRKIRKDCGDSQ
ncbi:MAG: hypothetical protein KDN20_08835 [Verrucomicrobiae bacterium]|nr:hypothetical protein [Verrucomicrobiae bacterium]